MPSTDDAPDLCAAVRKALRRWHQPENGDADLSSLHLHGQLMRDRDCTPRQATNEVLLQALERLQQQQPDDAELLQLRYLDNHSVLHVANRRNVADSTLYVQQRRAIARLCATLQDMEEALIQEKRAALEERLGAPIYGKAVGFAAPVAELLPRLISDEAPWLIAIEGIGGIGKTTLADVLMRRLVLQPSLAGVAWVSAQPSQLLLDGSIRLRADAPATAQAVIAALCRQILPEAAARHLVDPSGARVALQRHLATAPHLLVVDNLETVEDLDALIPMLSGLADPSKVLLTTRQRYEGEYALFHYLVPELSGAHARQLLRQEGRRINLPALAEATDAPLTAIYDAVGGNPLALRLIAGQLHHTGQDELLVDLREARGRSIENLYTFIYRRAWDALAERERRVLLAMPLVPAQGEDADFLSAVSGLDGETVRDGLTALVRLNLVNAGGDLQKRRYSIHSLTRAFLHEQVARWQ